MKIATYNLRKGGSQRVHWVKMIEAHGVDLLLVQESFSQAEQLQGANYVDADQRCVWEPVAPNRWGSAIFTRCGSVKPVPVNGFAGWVVGAEVNEIFGPADPETPLLVFSVHAPSRKESYHKQVNVLLDELARLSAGRAIVIGGDFNLTVSNWPGPDRPTNKHELAIQARLENEFELINCWQTANLRKPLSQTLRWTNNRTIPYHCDGIFVPKKWKDRLVSGDVLSGGEWDRLSDHNPVIATFE